jgi:hypothetical protein
MDASLPPATCPDPATLVQGAQCSAAGLVCKGNPTACGGATFYDALDCDGSKFLTIAMTVCGIDAGMARPCTGCIDGFGMCSDGSADAVCGTGGAVCQDCSKIGQTCRAGACSSGNSLDAGGG